MRFKWSLVVVAAASFLLAPAAFAQTAEQGNVGRIHWSWARPGQVTQYEAGSKKHHDFHRMKNDPWELRTWQVVSGNRGAQYVIGSFWHHWKDFDNLPIPTAEHDADYFKTIEPYEASWRGEHVVYMPSHSYPPEDVDATEPIYTLWLVEVKQEMNEAYLNAVKKIPEAARKAGVNWRYTFWAIADGNSTTAYYVSFPHKNWAERGEQGSPFEEILAKAYGRAEAHEMIRTMNKAVARETSMVLLYRPDLSYAPAPK